MSRSGFSLRARLVLAMLAVGLVVLGLSYVATYGLVRRALEDHALANLRDRADALATFAQEGDLANRPALRRVALRLSDLRLVAIRPDGRVAGAGDEKSLPDGLSSADIRPEQLLAGEQVSGRRGGVVFLAIPTDQRAGRARVVVVATDTVDLSVLRRLFPLLILAGLLVLALAGLVATGLARQLTRPIRAIERAARRLATGDLAARASVPPSTDEDLAALARTLNDMAARLEHAQGAERAFLLSISHDLRTPLTSIRGYAEALADGTLDDADPDERKRAATVIGAEARRLERLVRDLLDLSRLDSRQFSLTPRQCDAGEVVRDAAAAFAPQAHDLGVTLAVVPGPVLPVELDADRLAQIVANLVENALKYAASRVEVQAAAHGEHEIAVVVTDDGPGIPAAELGRVFERLYTVRDTPGRSVGTGLGLAIVRELAAAMGGRAWADAPPEGGSRFVVALPTRAPGLAPGRAPGLAPGRGHATSWNSEVV
jgi:two-component system sensor histidine kinase BaeS